MGNNNKLPSATRRLFLQRSLLALTTVAAAPMVSANEMVSSATSASAIPKLNVLTAEDYRILSAVTDAIIPQGGAFPVGALDVDLAMRIDHYLHEEETAVIEGIRSALMFIEHQAPTVFAGNEARFSALDSNDREAILVSMRDAGGVPTIIFSAMRGLSIFYFYTHEDTWPHIGYDGPLVKRPNPVQQKGV